MSNVVDLIEELAKDLERSDVLFIERLPPVREWERYRDVILKILREFHIALIIVRVIFRSERKGYAIIIKGEGELNQLPSKGVVEGFLVKCINDECEKIIYKEVTFNNPQELVENIQKFAKLYHKAEARIVEYKMPEAYREASIYY